MKPKLEVEYRYDLEEEDQSVRGNAIDSGNAVDDRQIEDEIIADLRRGNLHAWCIAHVRVFLTFSDKEGFAGESEGDAYLGGCSYSSEKQLWESMTLEYDLEWDARENAVEAMHRKLTVAETKVFDRLMAEYEQSAELKRLMARQKRATEMLKHPPEWASPNTIEWAQRELVQIDEELEKL